MVPVGKLAQTPGHILQGYKIEKHEICEEQHYEICKMMAL